MNRVLRSLLLLLICLLLCFTPVLAAGTVTEQDAPVAEDLFLNAY